MKSKEEFSWIVYLLLMEYALSEDTCERGACLGQLSFGDVLPRSAFTTKYEVSPYQCATECRLRIQRCKSFNYRRTALSCQLCEEDSGPGGKYLQPKAGSIHSNIDSWKNIPIGHCNKTNCSWTHRCDPSKTDGENVCVPTECPFAELKLAMTIEPANETAVRTKARRRCVSHNMERGDPITTCLESEAKWSNPDFKCVCESPPLKSGAISETGEVEVGENYTYKCPYGLFVKGDPNQTITCLFDGSWTSTRFICVKQNWKQDMIYRNNIHQSEVIRIENETEILECMQHCDEKLNHCLSFFYDNQTSQCFLSSSFRRGLPRGSPFSDWLVYYTAPASSCDMDYKNVSLDGSYFCIKFYDTGKIFKNAMKTCESEKAKLLVVTTKKQISDLAKFLLNNTGRAFTGISDEHKEGRWVSWDGNDVTPDWNGPAEGKLNADENCGVIDFEEGGVIDVSCESIYFFLCHKN